MTTWTKEEFRRLAETDDPHVSPFGEAPERVPQLDHRRAGDGVHRRAVERDRGDVVGDLDPHVPHDAIPTMRSDA